MLYKDNTKIILYNDNMKTICRYTQIISNQTHFACPLLEAVSRTQTSQAHYHHLDYFHQTFWRWTKLKHEMNWNLQCLKTNNIINITASF